ncbi:MAG: hypothetical protein K0S53_3100 [Bacteroidetes bacterium]|jgi:hypothetical protein|nr:hypothetical protein [Bacteroidota bacterium]MDF2453077.1 hypothetical protein [Bacteroidota bacterium]
MMTITEEQNIFTIRENFNQVFSNLKLEFYAKPCQSDGPAERGSGNQISINECRTIYHDGDITITPQTIASNLEQDFRRIFGLGVVVFKRNGNFWLDTYDFKNLTLEELNRL